ncbi:MAG: 7-carboxy-7-deazaguanine synthase QueE [Blastomonas sp.]
MPKLRLATTRPGDPEIFRSIQGEGASAGAPCAFIRLSDCNLACRWCDTAYTWNFSGANAADTNPHRSGETFERRDNQLQMDAVRAANRIANLGQSRLVITGGEPLLQPAALVALIEALPAMRIEVETNGSIAPGAALDARIDQYNVSPKLAHSGNAAADALKPELLDRWATDPRAWFKFVIAAPGDIDEVLALKQRHGMIADRIFLMPEGTDSATLRERASWLTGACLDHGFRFSDRLHIHLYGDRRGT